MYNTFLCDHCGAKIARKDNLVRHVINRHLNLSKKRRGSNSDFKISCMSCNYIFSDRNEYIRHVITVHDTEIKIENLSFNSVSEFVSWKINVEHENLCRYVQKGGIQKLKKTTKKYFYCHRDGPVRFRAPKPRKRQLKQQGSNKIGHVCTSRIVYTESTSGTINVEFVSTHYGHDDNTERLNLTNKEQIRINEKIEAGVAFDTILDTIYDDINEMYCPATLTDKQDPKKIMRDFDLNPWKSHMCDAISVDLWYRKVSTIEETSMNPIIFYKKQSESFPDDRLHSDDTILIISNQFQRKMLRNFGGNVVCTDTIHSRNQYDFYLSALVVVDEYGVPIPAAYCLSNKKNVDVFSVFYEKIKLVVDTVSPKVFMSGDDQSSYNAWNDVMGPVQSRFICGWHVDKSWRENICSKICKKEKRAVVYKGLRMLLQEVNIDSFCTSMKRFLQQTLTDTDTKTFGEYFSTYYEKRAACWAYSYRKNYAINTNMRLETVYRFMEYFYLNGKKIERLDKCIDALMKYTRNCLFRRLRRKGKLPPPAQLRNIQLSHEKALSSKWNANVTPDEIIPNVWYVRSFVNEKVHYTVEMVLESVKICNDYCPAICKQCSSKICIHTFSCECVDHLIKNDICKHIHAVVLFLDNTIEQCNPDVLQENIQEVEISVLHVEPYIEMNLFTSQNEDHIKEFHTKTMMILEYLENPNLIPCTSEEALELRRNFDTILNVLMSKIPK